MSSKGSKLASDVKFYLDYSKWQEDKQKAETWEDSVNRVMTMHRTNPKLQQAFNNPRFVEYFDLADKLYKDKWILGSQRALQFGGAPMMKHQMKMYNCTSSYVDRLDFFSEAFYILLCGCGVGCSVQKRHVDKLPDFTKRERGTKTYVIEDSIEGWSDALAVLMSSFAMSQWSHKEYKGYVIHFDYSQIRSKGAEISGGFKAPGPDGLRNALEKIEAIMNSIVNNGVRMRTIQAYDILMHAADAVLSGGVRRSATIVLFDWDDEEMLKAKTGNWFFENPQRGRSNNSVILLRDNVNYEDFKKIFESIKQFGEPGFYFVDDLDQLTNPCLSGDSMITTEDGEISIKDLVERIELGLDVPNVLTFNEETKQIEVKPIDNGKLSKKNANLIKLTLDNGEEIKLTPDHKVLTENRGWIEASQLTTSDILISI